jgi:hypothetical protein
MTTFDPQFFKKFEFGQKQISGYLRNAARDLEIAEKDSFVEVRFSYCYQAMLKSGIALIAKQGYKTRSVVGHHIKILEKMAEILKNPEIAIYGNAMRAKRNLDLYEGGVVLGESEVSSFVSFVKDTLNSIRSLIERDRDK